MNKLVAATLAILTWGMGGNIAISQVSEPLAIKSPQEISDTEDRRIFQ